MKYKKASGKKIFSVRGPRNWTNLPVQLRELRETHLFRATLPRQVFKYKTDKLEELKPSTLCQANKIGSFHGSKGHTLKDLSSQDPRDGGTAFLVPLLFMVFLRNNITIS